MAPPLPSHRWTIQVSAGSDYESLGQQMGGNDLWLSSSDDPETGRLFFAYSYHADQLSDPLEASRRIYSLGVIFNGAIRVAAGKLQAVPVRFDRFDDGNRCYQVSASDLEENPFSNESFIDEERENVRAATGNTVSHLILLAKRDEVIRSILLLAGLIETHETLLRIHSWNSLYKIVDSVKFGCKRDNIPLESVVDSKNLDAFKAACNKTSVIGIYARHGLNGTEVPKKVMSDLNEACNLVLEMAFQYCRQYVSSRKSSSVGGARSGKGTS